jgi:hypothetical protein
MSEKHLHLQVAEYIRAQYPKALLNVDLSGIKLTIGQAKYVKKLRSGRAFPDLVIYEKRHGYIGLFIELKVEGTKIYKENGELYSNKHLKEQAEMLTKLEDRGYCACFAVGFDEAKRVIDYYLSDRGY